MDVCDYELYNYLQTLKINIDIYYEYVCTKNLDS